MTGDTILQPCLSVLDASLCVGNGFAHRLFPATELGFDLVPQARDELIRVIDLALEQYRCLPNPGMRLPDRAVAVVIPFVDQDMARHSNLPSFQMGSRVSGKPLIILLPLTQAKQPHSVLVSSESYKRQAQTCDRKSQGPADSPSHLRSLLGLVTSVRRYAHGLPKLGFLVVVLYYRHFRLPVWMSESHMEEILA
ncbi:hypothetical protein [Cupriavidus sp. D39]|uniref:hypothetical protein n=1 Tax=Cupriavidus sp. D39 TaxID=2997877 RepID=UPI00226DBA5D|nr:hypothetical protein [Cupriavidus sp. D39]MCY0852963.1 hypothetical protein [Cupriavidus sp. D39]